MTIKQEIADIDRQTAEIASVRESLSATLNREAVSDARENVTTWLDAVNGDIRHVSRRLERAHSAACQGEPVTALVILPLIKAAREIEAKINELIQARKEQR